MIDEETEAGRQAVEKAHLVRITPEFRLKYGDTLTAVQGATQQMGEEGA